MQKVTDKQKKYVWLGAATLALIHFAPRYIATISHGVHASATSTSKPSPVRLAPAQPALPPAPLPSPQSSQAGKYAGIYVGSALMPNQDTCRIRLELRVSQDDPDKLTGYESKSCVPTSVMRGGKLIKDSIPDIIRKASPVSAVMTGSLSGTDIDFKVDKVIGAQPGDCVLSGFTVSPFGDGQVQAQWQEGNCASGQMLLSRARG